MSKVLACAALVAAMSPAAARAGRPSDPTHEQLLELDTEPPVIEIVTMGPGDRFVERFGHAALCVRWPAWPQLDVCYNYGTTDFARPWSLAWGFVRGDAAFWVEAWPRQQMLDHYVAKDRSVWMQVLDASNTTDDTRLAIARKLVHDVRIENRDYVYHHFFDNCTTRVRDIVDEAFGGRLKAAAGPPPGPSFREYGVAGLSQETWFVAATDFAIGRSADDHPSAWQAMFLPRRLRQGVADALGIEPRVEYQRVGPPVPQSGSRGRAWSLLVVVLIALPAWLTRLLGRRQRLGLALTCGALGLLGAALWLAALVSPMPELRWNEALLLFTPTDWLVPLLGPRRRLLYGRARLAIIVATSLLVAVGAFHQPLWIPILLAFLGTGSYVSIR